MIASPAPPTTASFEEKVTQRLADVGLTMPELAARVGLPEPELRALCQGNNPRLSELELLGGALRIDPCYFLPPIKQVGSFNQAGNGNTLKVKVGKAAAHQLVAELAVCRRVLDMSTQLLAAKDEIISLLRGGHNRPN